ncbi:MAG: GTPase Era, partial [Clostridia bacterium]|nr:GTPase Era [Clostridia bacterium]
QVVQVALDALEEVDLVLFMVEALSPGAGDNFILEQLRQISTPVILLINKIDQISKEELLPLMQEYSNWHSFAEIVPVSAAEGENVQRLLEVIKKYLPSGPQYYPDGMVTDRPERFIMGELIREKALRLTSQEVPHSVAVVVEEVSQRPNGLVDIMATIYIERESQQGILIGKGGSMLKKIGQQAREELENLLGSKIFLQLRVKVKSDWRNREDLIHRFGYGLE